ncbi:hypothetical protein [Haloferula sp.]|uniref:hypothetical protein n=1 Tax=Haloferula sp. TaxID=2497595 RepID=UPI00329F5B40
MSKEGSPLAVKVLAVVSAVALGAGYVAWKDGQAKNARIEALEKRVAEWEEVNEDVTFIVGSKSPGRDVLNFETLGGDSEVVEIPGIPSQAPMMPGSKSAMILTPEPDDEKAIKQLMSGSKWGPIVPPVAEEEETPPELLIPSSKSLSPIFDIQREVEKP